MTRVNNKSYISIHNHSHFSLLDGICSPADLAKQASEMGFGACGISDHGSISGWIKFYKACKEHNIRPILGVEAYWCPDVKEKKRETFHICLFSKTNKGVKSIFRLMSKAHEVFYYKPRIDTDMLYDTEDLICSTACLKGLLRYENYERLITTLHSFFEDSLYLEIMPLLLPDQEVINQRAIELHEKYQIPLLATNDIHYLQKGDSRLHNFLLNLKTDGRMEFDVEGLYLKTHEEMCEAFSKTPIDNCYWEQALANTLEVADKCNVTWDESSIVLPQVVEENSTKALKKILKDRIKIAYPFNKFEYQERLDYELSIIDEKGFVDYFLLVYDLVEAAKKAGVQLGCGRGSAGGSLICYILGITDIDPMEEGLLFERFLNPERTDYPDIDLDFPRSKRQFMINYLKERWGEDRVSFISTVAEMKLKSSFKDVARKLGVPFMIANKLSAYLEDGMGTLSDYVEENPEFRKLLDPAIIDDLVYYADGLAGTLRQESRHAAGIVIAPQKLEHYGVLERRKDEISLNWDMNDVSYQGLVKIDVLGLRTLDVMAEALELIKERHGKTIDWKRVHLNDPTLLAEFGSGHVAGIFQFEQGPTAHLVKRLNPVLDKSILVDCNALIRPGPKDSGMTDKYVKRHKGEETEYDEPYIDYLLDNDIAQDTYGVIIYQEQVIEVLRKIAGYTIPQADTIRRIFAKKKGDFEEHRENFVNGCLATVGMLGEIASGLFDHLETFSRYGFNKSHAAAYTELGLRQMYLKVNYPLEYMTALFKWTPEKEKKEKFADECRRVGIAVLAPDINTSGRDFQIEEDAIRIGLGAIKGVGDSALGHIEKQRKNRRFKSILDFRLRIPKKSVNKAVMRSLILTGAFDSLGCNHKLWLEDLIEREATEIPDIQIAEICEDYPEDEKEINKTALIPGVYKINIEPRIGLNIDEENLEDLRTVIGECRNCSLRNCYDCPTPFEYTLDSKVMIIAEAPGKEELQKGRPLIGDAGDELMKRLAAVGIMRRDCFLSNVFKCRPMDNKLPKPCPKDCYEILKLELEILQPKIILALGNTPRGFFTGEASGIQQAADKLEVEIEVLDGKAYPVLYSVHPSSLFYGNGAENAARLEASIEVLAKIFFKEMT